MFISTEHTMPIDDRLITIIDNLTRAVNVCYAAENATPEQRQKDWDLEYPYAAGYSRSAMNTAIDDLSRIVKELRDEVNLSYGGCI